MSEGTLHLIVPGPIDQRTGGFLYDARMADELRRAGVDVRVHQLRGTFPLADEQAHSALDRALGRVRPGDIALVDGLAGGGLPDVIEAHSDRVPVLALVHHPLADETGLGPDDVATLTGSERRALAASRGVVVTSPFTARRLGAFGVTQDRIRVVEPGTEPAAPATGPGAGRPPGLLCVASLTPRKGHDVLVRALADLVDLEWDCAFVGSDTLDGAHAAAVRAQVDAHDLGKRVRFAGELGGPALEEEYARASIFVFPSHYEGYGMALTEAIARGLPVVSTTGGAIPFTVPAEASVLVPPGDHEALGAALRSLLEERDAGRLDTLRRAARSHATSALRGWVDAAQELARAVDELSRPPDPEPAAHTRFSAVWLEERERVDHRSRSAMLAERLALHLRGARPAAARPARLIDLGSGTGSNVRYLAPRIDLLQSWVLVDHDPHLLADARLPPEAGKATRIVGDLAGEGLERAGDADAVTASALLDLVSVEWLRALVEQCTRGGAAALFALSYDGTTEWVDEPRTDARPEEGRGDTSDPEDAYLRDLVNQHQGTDKGMGAALGPEAATIAEELFRIQGYRTWLLPTPWELGPQEAELAARWVDGWVEAAVEQAPDAAPRIRLWAERRARAIRSGAFRLRVGHLDLLALPPAGGAGAP